MKKSPGGDVIPTRASMTDRVAGYQVMRETSCTTRAVLVPVWPLTS